MSSVPTPALSFVEGLYPPPIITTGDAVSAEVLPAGTPGMNVTTGSAQDWPISLIPVELGSTFHINCGESGLVMLRA